MENAELTQRFSHHTIKVNDVNLHYAIGGQGAPILLWHGFLETWYCWRKVMPTLAKRYTVIAPDMRELMIWAHHLPCFMRVIIQMKY